MSVDPIPVTPPPETTLTREEQAAIRGYLFKLVTPSAIVLALITFLLGYSIKDVAQSKAEATATIRIADALAQANVARDNAKTMADDVEKIRGRLDTASKIALSKSDELVAQVTASLLANKQFSADMQQSLASGYAKLDQQYYVTSGLTGLNLDVLYAKKEVGAPVGQATATPSQTWKLSQVK